MTMVATMGGKTARAGQAGQCEVGFFLTVNCDFVQQPLVLPPSAIKVEDRWVVAI